MDYEGVLEQVDVGSPPGESIHGIDGGGSETLVGGGVEFELKTCGGVLVDAGGLDTRDGAGVPGLCGREGRVAVLNEAGTSGDVSAGEGSTTAATKGRETGGDAAATLDGRVERGGVRDDTAGGVCGAVDDWAGRVFGEEAAATGRADITGRVDWRASGGLVRLDLGGLGELEFIVVLERTDRDVLVGGGRDSGVTEVENALRGGGVVGVAVRGVPREAVELVGGDGELARGVDTGGDGTVTVADGAVGCDLWDGVGVIIEPDSPVGVRTKGGDEGDGEAAEAEFVVEGRELTPPDGGGGSELVGEEAVRLVGHKRDGR